MLQVQAGKFVDPSQIPTVKYDLQYQLSNLIPLNKDAFLTDANRNQHSNQSTAKSITIDVQCIINSLLDTILKAIFSYKHSTEKNVLAINTAFKRKLLKFSLKSVGVVDVE